SNSGRVVLHPEDWTLQAQTLGFQVSWDAVPLSTDSFYATPPADDRIETVVTIAQNLPDTFHLLLLKASAPGTPAIRAIRVYSPAERYAATYHAPALKLVLGRGGVPQLEWPAWLPGWQPERASSLNLSAGWAPILDSPVVIQQNLTLQAPGDDRLNLYHLRFVSGFEGL
ncbi:MAG TPA: hypothetical protein VMB21_05525, partial [Candidatus Limnocylindria bacterium]|nr:hypothetical protein [Candidatus Limnocylindria bacterium]